MQIKSTKQRARLAQTTPRRGGKSTQTQTFGKQSRAPKAWTNVNVSRATSEMTTVARLVPKTHFLTNGIRLSVPLAMRSTVNGKPRKLLDKTRTGRIASAEQDTED